MRMMAEKSPALLLLLLLLHKGPTLTYCDLMPEEGVVGPDVRSYLPSTKPQENDPFLQPKAESTLQPNTDTTTNDPPDLREGAVVGPGLATQSIIQSTFHLDSEQNNNPSKADGSAMPKTQQPPNKTGLHNHNHNTSQGHNLSIRPSMHSNIQFTTPNPIQVSVHPAQNYNLTQLLKLPILPSHLNHYRLGRPSIRSAPNNVFLHPTEHTTLQPKHYIYPPNPTLDISNVPSAVPPKSSLVPSPPTPSSRPPPSPPRPPPSFSSRPHARNHSRQHVLQYAALTLDNTTSYSSSSSSISAFGNGSAIVGENGTLTQWPSGPSINMRVSATEPYIDPATPLHVTAQVGSPARLSCFVNNLGQRTVSWVRHRDIHVLTLGRFTFTNDERFVAHNEDGSNEWVLTIKFPRRADSGIYECQINTKPVTSQLISLRVMQPRAVIASGPEVYLNRGSTLQLNCSVIDAARPLDFLLWYRGQQVASYEDARIHIELMQEEDATWSTLRLEDANEKDSGTYTCSPSNAKEASVRVHVLLKGEHPAAMQTNTGSSRTLLASAVPLLTLLVSLLNLGPNSSC